jgi:hypothetical protein
MFSRKQKHIMLKFFSLFSVVRGYNILVIIIAQYLTSIYILAPNLPVGKVLFDVNVLMLVLASTSAIAAGYIINSFYDSDKDFINRPLIFFHWSLLVMFLLELCYFFHCTFLLFGFIHISSKSFYL